MSRTWLPGWERGRSLIAVDELRRALRGRGHLLAIGVGDGVGELDALGAVIAAVPRPVAGDVPADVAAALPHLPFRPASFDAVVALDVLSGIEDDALAALELARVLAPGGALVVIASALRTLFSAHDEAQGRLRRYEPRQLARLLAGAGLSVERLTFCDAVRLLPIAALRVLDGPGHGARRAILPRVDLAERLPEPVHDAAERLVRTERRLLARTDLPVGASLLAVARKR